MSAFHANSNLNWFQGQPGGGGSTVPPIREQLKVITIRVFALLRSVALKYGVVYGRACLLAANYRLTAAQALDIQWQFIGNYYCK